jgi:antitoxin CptB
MTSLRAKQSISPSKERMDCFVAALLAMTAVWVDQARIRRDDTLSIIRRPPGLTFTNTIAISTPPGTSGLLALDWIGKMTGSTRSSGGLDDRRKRLLFRCWHRGTREMDLILGRFADAEIAGLADDELAQFERLIEVPDPDLYAALTGDRPLAPEHASPLFDRIKSFRAVDYDA